MYSTCVSCGASLGSNEALEAFPVGRRLAFDPHRGRLWVLCSACRSWNLAPLEERWEAVEEAERLFERATVGLSSGNIALGRVRGGTELLRVGRVDRPELAFWRYGDRLVGRWRKHRRALWLSLGAGVVTGLVPVLGSLPAWSAGAAWMAMIQIRERRPLMRTRTGELVRFSHAGRALLLPTDAGEGWRLALPRRRDEALVLEGEDALRALRGLLPRVNLRGGSPEQVRNAVDEVERLGSAGAVFRASADELRDLSAMRTRIPGITRPHRLATAHPVIHLALEMAANEEVERRALRGEMRLLEREWREAEELAAIGDDLLFPDVLRRRIHRWKQDRGGTLSPAERIRAAETARADRPPPKLP